MPGETGPQLAEVLQHTQEVISALDDSQYRTINKSFTATDETATVRVTVNGARWLTGLHIEHGLLRLGADTVKQRINEALHKAQEAAVETAESEEDMFEQTITALSTALQQHLGDLPGANGGLSASKESDPN
ncbi:MAG: YbaB/EbfC family nucleoid-associated protein [Actinomycetota bacterium]|uniref:YbaB/EbfC family nucleoid-associated protein n=1 Tax=Mycobacterium lentiflavum TaxID=141349 RepID=A0ABY5T2X5_MYCLN|nr:YbaB/EbfC family nucleoid-associated protein [Mycobacterium lentiflavum]MEE3064362.1 YbaB/EbfC family nucleoid-associated protein [Actinomycetota bacterium]UVI52111.1 YbaB/EbfC family nucleoid-associated protein [Mycobacterium lentiflavum]